MPVAHGMGQWFGGVTCASCAVRRRHGDDEHGGSRAWASKWSCPGMSWSRGGADGVLRGRGRGHGRRARRGVHARNDVHRWHGRAWAVVFSASGRPARVLAVLVR